MKFSRVARIPPPLGVKLSSSWLEAAKIAEGYLYQKTSQDKCFRFCFAAEAPFFVMNLAKGRCDVDRAVGTAHSKQQATASFPAHALSSAVKFDKR